MCHCLGPRLFGVGQVKLEIFSEKDNVDQLDWAMESLKVRRDFSTRRYYYDFPQMLVSKSSPVIWDSE